jgi:chemotaxis protein MotB
VAKSERPIIIVKRQKRDEGGHHGGAWKVAYADFVTAMMAFFLVMWLVASVTKEQRAALFEYFKNPSMEPGKFVKPAPGQNGPGGASTSPINLGGGIDAPRTVQDTAKPGIGIPVAPPLPEHPPAVAVPTPPPPPSTAQSNDGEENQHLEALLTPYLNSVPNRISLTGHTDTTPYVGHNGHTNSELSSDRANAARRSLEAAGLASDKVARIVGLSSSVLLDKDNPRAAINRRISIILMTRHAEEEAHKTDEPEMAREPAHASK